MSEKTVVAPKCFPVKVLARTYPYDQTFSESALRALIFNAQDRVDSKGKVVPGNGLSNSGAVIRLGRRVLINVEKFDAWLLSSQSAKISRRRQ